MFNGNEISLGIMLACWLLWTRKIQTQYVREYFIPFG